MRVVKRRPPEEPSAVAPFEDDRLLVDSLVADVERARTSLTAFFEFVMREEHTRARLRAMPHQRVLFDFIAAHDRFVVRMPPGFSKTYAVAAYVLFQLGHFPTERAAFISGAEEIASRPLVLVRDYVADEDRQFPELHLVFPDLKRSPREEDAWSKTKLVIDRPRGIRDPSLAAYGAGGAIMGARLSCVLCDDALNEENTATKEQRRKFNEWFFRKVVTRRDVRSGAKIGFLNTPWNRDDATYALERAGWPTLTMEIEGDVFVSNTDWTSAELRPSRIGHKAKRYAGDNTVKAEVRCYRLAAHDAPGYAPAHSIVEPTGRMVPAEGNVAEPGDRVVHLDAEEQVPLWPEKFGRAQVEELRADPDFQLLYKMNARNNETSRCKLEWIEQCKELARRAGYLRPVQRYTGGNLVTCGIDLAFGEDESSARNALVTVELVPSLVIDGREYKWLRRLLDVDVGRWQGKDLLSRIKSKAVLYNAFLRVETNGAQKFVRSMAVDDDQGLPIRAHTTGANKHHRVHGVERLFVELQNGAWLIPNDEAGRCEQGVQELVDALLDYRPPPAHTPDEVMAMWMAREEIRAVHGESMQDERPGAKAIGAQISVR